MFGDYNDSDTFVVKATEFAEGLKDEVVKVEFEARGIGEMFDKFIGFAIGFSYNSRYADVCMFELRTIDQYIYDSYPSDPIFQIKCDLTETDSKIVRKKTKIRCYDGGKGEWEPLALSDRVKYSYAYKSSRKSKES